MSEARQGKFAIVGEVAGKKHQFQRVRRKRSGGHYGTTSPQQMAKHYRFPEWERVVWRCWLCEANASEFKGKFVPARWVEEEWRFFPEETIVEECSHKHLQ
jgi:hypothetical protein